MRYLLIWFTLFAPASAWAFKWGLSCYAAVTTEVLFSGTLKDEGGLYLYDPKAIFQYDIERPVNCGIMRMKGSGGESGVGLTLPTHYMSFWGEDVGWTWDKVSGQLSGKEGTETLYERRTDTSKFSITVERHGTFSLYRAEHYMADNENVQAAGTRGTSEVLLIRFMNGRPVGVEQRQYHMRVDQRQENVWPSGRKHILKTDENGGHYYLEWRCETDATS